MADNKKSIFQRLNTIFDVSGIDLTKVNQTVNKYSINNDVLLKTQSKEEYEAAKLQAQQSKFLGGVWRKTENELIQHSMHYETTRIGSYADFESMEFYPEIAAALDIMMEECLAGSTMIPLLNGSELTMKEIYDNNLTDFWVYSVDLETNKIKPSKVEKAILKGIKKVFKITLDDDTELLCTDNHKWLRYDNTWVETKDLLFGDSLKIISRKLDYKGYEKVSLTNFNGDTKHTHIIVGENQMLHIKEQLNDNNPLNEKIIIHHKSFNKLNNDPNELEYMLWSEHQKLHTDLNRERWKDEEYSKKMRKIFSETAKKTMLGVDKEVLVNRLQKGLKEKLSNLSLNEQKILLNRGGKHNGMYGSNRTGKLNPNYNQLKNHVVDINETEYIKFNTTIKGNRRKLSMEKFNLDKHSVITYNKFICNKYNLNRIEDLDFIVNNAFDINKIKDYFSCDKNNNLKTYCEEWLLSISSLRRFLKIKGYNNLKDLKSTIGNHRVIKVEYYGEEEVYDLVNSSVSQNFAIKCNNGLVISHNCTTVNNKGRVLNVYSDSKRIQGILEDLFFNRLDLHASLPMWTRNICKYGDNFLLLNIDDKKGIVGARQLPNFEIERREGDIVQNQYSGEWTVNNEGEDAKVKFMWRGRDMEFNSWQIAHFRLLGDDRRLPYGTSVLEKARRIWKQLQLSEDAMLVYRVTRAPERRVYKIYVGNIDEKDVPQYVDDIANRFKRKPVIDPQTGQIDLRYNQLANDQDYFIPVRDENAATPIDTLQGASNLDQIADIQYLQRKLFTALRVPKTFLGFEEATGEGKNLAMQDIRFSRTINRIQQAMIVELNKIAIIHLYMLGFEDEISNFNLSLNNPSTQAKMLEIEQLQAKMTLYKDAVSEAGNGFMGMSMTRARRDILGWSDEEIKKDFLEQRLEKAAAAEIENTSAVIKHTGMFDEVDGIYGDINAAIAGAASEGGEGGDSGLGGGGGGSFGGGGGFGGATETPEAGEPALEGGEPALEGGEEAPAETPEAAPEETLAEQIKKTNQLLTENTKQLNQRKDKYSKMYVNRLIDNIEHKETIINERVAIYDKTLKINDDINGMINDIDNMLKD